jgi:hypothetical protein
VLKNDLIVCGTSTTGTGTLTLAACPAPPGGVDPYQWLNANGFNAANAAAFLISYQLVEFTDATFAAAKQYEKGIGTLTFSTSGVASCTLARTTVQETASGLNTATSAPVYQAPSAITIGTAANCLVFIGPSAAETPAFCPYFETGLGDNLGVPPYRTEQNVGNASSNVLVSLTDYYSVFEWRVPMLVKKCTVRVAAAASGASAAYARIYQIGTNGRPGKLLVDFGAFAGTNPLSTGGTTISTTPLTNGFLLLPGEYFWDFLPSFASGSPTVATVSPTEVPCYGRLDTSVLQPYLGTTATGGTAGAAPDPANTTGYAGVLGNAANHPVLFLLAPS